MDREAETGEAVSCAVSLDGVPLRSDGDGEARWASSGTVSGADGTRLKTLSFGPETGKTTALLAAEVAHVRKVRPDAGRRRRRCARQLDVSREAPARRAGSRLLSCLRTSRRSCRPSRPTGTTAPPCAPHGVDKVGDTLSPRQGDDENGGSSARARVLPQAQAPHALREPQGQGLHAPASSANKVLVNQRMKRARWSVDGGQNVLTFRALSGRFDAAWQTMTGTCGANDSLNAVAA